MKKELFGLSLIELQELLVAAGLKKFRAAQVYQWLYQKSVTAFDQMRNLSKADIAILEANFTLLPQQLKILREPGIAGRSDPQGAARISGRQFGRDRTDAP